MRKIINRSKSARTRIEQNGFLATLRSSEGVIDLASILVGVLITGIIAGGILATVFMVVPWAQDEAAKGDLATVNQAESVAYTMGFSSGSAVYQDLDGLVSYADPNGDFDGLIQDSDGIVIVLGANSRSFTAVSESASGKFFSITNADPTVVTYDDLAALNAALGTSLVGTFDTAAELIFTPTP